MLQDLDIIKAYYTMFGRAPEKEGFDYWKSEAAQHGWSLSDLVNTFLQLPVVQEAGYPLTQSADGYVTNLYATLFGKTPDDNGYWAGQLNNGVSKGDLLSTMVQAALGTPDGTLGKDNIINKLAFSQYVVSIQQTNNISLDPSLLKEWTESVNDLTESVATAIKGIYDKSGATLNLFPNGTIPSGSSDMQLSAAILSELNIFKTDLYEIILGSGSQDGNTGGSSGSSELLASDMEELTSLVTMNTNGGILSTESLREATLKDLANDAYYYELFNPSNYWGHEDGIFAAEEIGAPGANIQNFVATTENLESIYYGTAIKALKAIDMDEAMQIGNFIQANAAALEAGNQTVLDQYIALMVSVFRDPAAVPLFTDQQIADSTAMGTAMAAQLVGSGDTPALFDGMLMAFM